MSWVGPVVMRWAWETLSVASVAQLRSGKRHQWYGPDGLNFSRVTGEACGKNSVVWFHRGLPGGRAVCERPLALRAHLAVGVPFSGTNSRCGPAVLEWSWPR
jgi:hypothetical protein